MHAKKNSWSYKDHHDTNYVSQTNVKTADSTVYAFTLIFAEALFSVYIVTVAQITLKFTYKIPYANTFLPEKCVIQEEMKIYIIIIIYRVKYMNVK